MTTHPTNSEMLRDRVLELLAREDAEGTSNLDSMLLSMIDGTAQEKIALIELGFGKAPIRAQVEAIGEVKLIVEHTADWMMAIEEPAEIIEVATRRITLEEERIGGPHDDPES